MPRKEHPERISKTQIIVAVIALIGVIAAALIGSVDKWWPKPGDNRTVNISNSSGGGGSSPSPATSPTQESGIHNCLEKDFAGAESVELGTSARIEPRDHLIIVYKDSGKPLGALKLKFIPNPQLDNVKFELEKSADVVDSECQEVKELSNMSRPAGNKVNSWLNYNFLRIQFGTHYYRLRFNSDGKLIEAQIEKLS